ncbi:MAG TPA: carboxypeptidase-like regulatory domain-containing protein, partial [Candidatus Sulfotelmatobacter sp.]|nr:carboxypeptidase-like regulatory domain-containing protein [Candidatus Sulfotelmatobacter sp.]
MFSLQRGLGLNLWPAGLAVLAFTTLAAAQASRVAGAVQGTVVDQTGSAVAGALVTLRNPATNRTRPASTDVDGFFRVSELPVGQYEVRVQSPGFSLYTNYALVVSIGRVSQLTVRLVPALVQQQITVSEQPSSIDASQTTEATTI